MVYLLAPISDAGFALSDSPMVHVTLNGQPREIANGMSLLDLALFLKLQPSTVICEHNGQLCRADTFADTHVQEGDAIEWLHFMGGGCGVYPA